MIILQFTNFVDETNDHYLNGNLIFKKLDYFN